MEKYTIRKNENLIVVPDKCKICILGWRRYENKNRNVKVK